MLKQLKRDLRGKERQSENKISDHIDRERRNKEGEEKKKVISAYRSLRRMFHYSTTLKSTLRNFVHYRPEISNKFSSFLLFIAANSRNEPRPMNYWCVCISTWAKRRNETCIFGSARCSMRGIACRTPLYNGILKRVCKSPSIAPRRNTS